MVNKESLWKPIRTAPRNDTILVVEADSGGDPYFAYYGYDSFYGKYRWTAVDEKDLVLAPKPTHWMLIPPAPGVDE